MNYPGLLSASQTLPFEREVLKEYCLDAVCDHVFFQGFVRMMWMNYSAKPEIRIQEKTDLQNPDLC